jgi:hypothetical protein
MRRRAGSTLRTTYPTQEVLRVFLRDPRAELFGYVIIEQITSMTLKSGSLYPILQRLENAGWLTSRWEDEEHAASQGRPPRRYYRLTGTGAASAPEYCAVPAGKMAPGQIIRRAAGATS